MDECINSSPLEELTPTEASILLFTYFPGVAQMLRALQMVSPGEQEISTHAVENGECCRRTWNAKPVMRELRHGTGIWAWGWINSGVVSVFHPCSEGKSEGVKPCATSELISDIRQRRRLAAGTRPCKQQRRWQASIAHSLLCSSPHFEPQDRDEWT